MNLLITGASGFLGQYVVAAAASRGHNVRALVRPASNTVQIGGIPASDLEIARADLRSRHGLEDVVQGVDAVIHLAAAKCGDIYDQLGGTVVATENLLDAMTATGVRHIVSISSFSVYDYRRMRTGSVLDESSPLEARPRERDAYCQTKLIQEEIVRDHAEELNWDWSILRPGVIYGRDNLWTARLGMKLGESTWVRTGAWARLPLTYVENCADAILLAAERPEASGHTFNIVDNETPNQRAYARKLQQVSNPKPRIIPVPYSMMSAIAFAGACVNRVCFGGRAKVPSIFVPASLKARCKPLRYSNRKLRNLLQWSPRFGFDEAVERSTSETSLFDTTPLRVTRHRDENKSSDQREPELQEV